MNDDVLTPAKASGSQSINRSLSMLRLFGAGGGPLRLTEIAAALDLNLSTAYRIARALVRGGFLRHTGSEGYSLGGTLSLLGAAARRSLHLDDAIKVLEEMRDRHCDTVSLGVREGSCVGVIHRVEASRELRFSQLVGSQVPMHASAMGKAILVGATELEAEIVGLGELKKLTTQTVYDRDSLVKEIRASKIRGFTVDDEEQVVGVRCIGAPIIDRNSVVQAAFAIQAPKAFLGEERLLEIGSLMPAYGRRLAEVMRL